MLLARAPSGPVVLELRASTRNHPTMRLAVLDPEAPSAEALRRARPHAIRSAPFAVDSTDVELGTLVRRKMDFTVEARPFLRTLMEKTGETVHLAILDHDSVLYIITHESKQALRMGSKVGTRVPVHSTAVGKALLAFQPDEQIARIIARGLPASVPNTVVDGKALQRELALVRARNYAVDDEESEVGLRSIAAPIRSHSGNVIAAISIAGPVHRMTKKMLLGWLRELVEAADAVSQRLGWSRSPGAARS